MAEHSTVEIGNALILLTGDTDPFGDGPLYYRCAGQSYDLWSIGPDGKDDDGRRIEGAATDQESRRRLVQIDSVGDIVAGWNR